MNLASVKAWFMQPSTVSGIGTILGGIVGAATQYYSHDPAAAVTLFAAVKGVTSVVLPDNSAAQGAIQKLIQDAVTAAVTKNAGAAGQLTLDGLNVIGTLKAAQAPMPVAVPAVAANPPQA